MYKKLEERRRDGFMFSALFLGASGPSLIRGRGHCFNVLGQDT